MNTAQITHALEQDPVTSKKFCSVFPSDKLPQTIDRYPCGFVANTDPSSGPGTHWVAFYFPSEEKGEFFDSYGHAPEYYRKSFGDFLKSRAWDFNRRKLQSAWSDVCGQYCIFYLSHRARGCALGFLGFNGAGRILTLNSLFYRGWLNGVGGWVVRRG